MTVQRNVRIFRPSKSALQSGRARAQTWVLEYELVSPRRPESLMGWTSAGDTLNQVRLPFDTVEQAVGFAKKNGWAYTVLPSHDRNVLPRNYVDNFKYVPPEGVGA